MCFSASASFTSAACLAGVGVLALSATKSRREWPYALIPLLFGMQQLLEAGVWLELQGQLPVIACGSASALVSAYTLFSQVLWPLFIPFAVVMLEPPSLRRKFIIATGFCGLVAGMFLLSAMTNNPPTAQITGQHIAYEFSHPYVWIATVLYLSGTCVCPMLSSHRTVRLFGVVALVSAGLTYVIFATWFISVWCYFAGWMSSVVLIHLYPEIQKKLNINIPGT